MEQVVILEPGKADERTRLILGRARKTQEFSHRVFVVEGEKALLDELRALPGVKTPAQLDAAEADALSASERLSIDAWQARAAGPEKARRGDGMSWGHKDFEAPR